MTPARAIERTWEILHNVDVDLGFMHITLFTYLLVPTAISVMMIMFKMALRSVSFASSVNSSVGKSYFKNKRNNALNKEKAAKDTFEHWRKHQTIDKGR